MTVTQEEFDEWRKSRCADWFFDRVEHMLKEQIFERQFMRLQDKTVDEIALQAVENLGYIAGVLSIRGLEYQHLCE